MASDRTRNPTSLEQDANDLYENAPCGYLSTVADGTIVRVNGTFLRWTGYDSDQLVGRRRFQELLTSGGRIYYETHLAPLLQMQGAVNEIAVEIACPGGRVLPVLMNSVMRPQDDSQPAVIRITIFDASDRRRYEQELLHLREKAELSEQRVRILQTAAAGLASAITVSDVGRVLTEATGRCVKATSSTIWLIDAKSGELTSGSGSSGPMDQTVRVAFDTGALATGTPADRVGQVAAPLVAGDQTTGVVHIVIAPGATLNEQQAALLEALGRQAGPALARAQLFEREQSVAHTLQAALLAGEPPADPRITIASVYRPAETSLDVGGDWFDAFMLDQDRLVMVVGDVAGRGLDAATAMGQLRSAIRAVAAFDDGPTYVLDRLNRFIENVAAAPMATVAYAEIDLAGGPVRYACAGHPPPAVLRTQGSAELLWDGRSAPLGSHLTPGSRTEGETRIHPGDTLVLFTDGLFLRRSEIIDQGLDRLIAELHRHRAQPLPLLVERLTTSLLADNPTHDDVCLLCVRLEQPATTP
jgi:PAS domain S-box-containing protein